MKTIMNLDNIKTLDEVSDFLNGSQPVVFEVASSKDERYAWVRKTLYRFDYRRLKKKHRGLVVKLLCKVSGYSRQQITRMIGQYHQTGTVKRQQRTSKGFTRKYTAQDVALLVNMDELHETPSGGTLKKLI